MTYVCIKCGHRWHDGEKSKEISGGLCDKCITTYIRKRQKSNGFQDCFRRAVEVCSREECSYHEVCCKYLEGLEKQQ